MTASDRRTSNRKADRSAAVPAAALGVCLAAALASPVAVTRPLAAQSVLDHTPNLAGAWIAPAGALQFNFQHRFSVSDPPERKVTSAPTFILAAGMPASTAVGLKYATKSELEAGLPNEWAVFGRLRADRDWPVSLGVEAEYNLAARSADGEATLEGRLGPATVLAVGRVFLGGDDGDAATATAGLGAAVRLSRSLGIAADAALDRRRGDPVWGVALNLAIPTTPHTLSIQATNTNSATIRGSATASPSVRYGFEFTIPITPARYRGRPARPAARPEVTVADGEIVQARIQGLAFAPDTIVVMAGTVIEWTNGDPVPHTVTSDDGLFDSGDLGEGEAWSLRFDEPGVFPFHCVPHPFMRGVIIVEARP